MTAEQAIRETILANQNNSGSDYAPSNIVAPIVGTWDGSGCANNTGVTVIPPDDPPCEHVRTRLGREGGGVPQLGRDALAYEGRLVPARDQVDELVAVDVEDLEGDRGCDRHGPHGLDPEK